MEPFQSEEIATQQRELRVGLAHAEIISDVLSVAPTLALTDIRFLSPFQISTFVRFASLRRTRDRMSDLLVQRANSEFADNEFKALKKQLEELAYEPQTLPEKALQQQREFEERKRRGETFRQRAAKSGARMLNPKPKRERFSIRRGRAENASAGADGTPRRILNSQLPKGIRI